MNVQAPFPWINHLNLEYHKVSKNHKKIQSKAYSIDLHEITKGFFQAIKKNQKKILDRTTVKRVNFLAQAQLNYYKSKKFSFIEKFFSAFVNLFVLGKFHSSAYLAKKLSDQILSEFKEKNKLNQLADQFHFKIPEKKMDFIKNKIALTRAQIKNPENKRQNTQNDELNNEINNIDPQLAEVEIVKDEIKDQQLFFKEQIINDLKKIWVAEDISVGFMNEIWDVLLKYAHIKSWEKISDNPTKYSLTLSKSLKGKYGFAFNFEIKENLEFIVIEKENIKILDFIIGDKKGMVGPLGTKLKSLSFKEELNSCFITFDIKGLFGGTYPMLANEAVDYIKKVEWTTNQ